MKRVPRKTVERALLYIRTLEGLIKAKRYLISSRELAALTGLSDVQIRKDISNFGKVGTPRIGYKTLELKNILEDFILQKNVVRVVLFGTGNLGSAILRYPGFRQGKIRLVAAFDKDLAKIGRKINDVLIHDIVQAPSVIKKIHADIGIIAVPVEASQDVADVMVLSGLKGIINFAPGTINVPETVRVKDIDLSIEFLSLFCSSAK
jgi:redox-sensing transcriptional repressor